MLCHTSDWGGLGGALLLNIQSVLSTFLLLHISKRNISSTSLLLFNQELPLVVLALSLSRK